MSETPAEPAADTRPWRKRHPVLSRSLLYGLGLGLALVLYLLLAERTQDDEAVRLAALQEELDSLSLVLASDPTGTRVLELLDEKFEDPGLPVRARGRALRWRAMAWRARWRRSGDEAAREDAAREVEAALQAAAELGLEPAERAALGLEWAEARLERADAAGAAAVLPEPSALESAPGLVLHALLVAQGWRLDGRPQEAAEHARRVLGGMRELAGVPGTIYVGGREWATAQAAAELAGFIAQVDGPTGAREPWLAVRRLGPRDFEAQLAAARGLAAGGHAAEALEAWRVARRLNAKLAAAEAANDPALRRLEERAAAQ